MPLEVVLAHALCARWNGAGCQSIYSPPDPTTMSVRHLVSLNVFVQVFAILEFDLAVGTFPVGLVFLAVLIQISRTAKALATF